MKNPCGIFTAQVLTWALFRCFSCFLSCVHTVGPVPVDISAQQHRDWAKLGFVRGIAVTPTMCYNLSSARWVSLLLRVVSGSLPEEDTHSAASAAHLPRQASEAEFLPRDRSLPAQPITIQKGQSRKKAHEPLRTSCISKKCVCHV